MNERAKPDAYGELIEPATVQMQRILPGPIERIWSYLTDSDMRRQWLASGDMQMQAGTPFELVWRNDELSGTPNLRPDGVPHEHRMQSSIIEIDPPKRLVFGWPPHGEVTFTLETQGREVLLTLVHRRISDRKNMVMVGAGWHMHLDTLVARANGRQPEPFWEGWNRLKTEYDRLLPA